MATPRITGEDQRKYNGPKVYADKKPEVADKAAKKIEKALLKCIDNLERLANGLESVVERWEPAGTIYQEVLLPPTKDGQRPIKTRELQFPDLPKDQMVLVSRVVTTACPDKQVNIYLVDRCLGKPVEQVNVATRGGGTVQITAADMLQSV
jgi:hypothetical protein